MSPRIKKFIRSAYPEHDGLISELKTVPKLVPRDIPLPEAVVRVVIGQMLSGAAAQTIYSRVENIASERKLTGSWLLDYDTLRYCGLSRSKAKNICEFGAKVGDDLHAFDYWRKLDVDTLIQDIKRNKGMGDWTASILALFYIGHEDIFPVGDGSLKRAINALEKRCKKYNRSYIFNPDIAQPYRSYLALYLWQAVDNGVLA